MRMNRKVKERYAGLARYLGLRFDEEHGVIYGERDGYAFRMQPYQVNATNTNNDMVAVSVGINNDGTKIALDDSKPLKKEHKQIFGIIQEKNTITMILKRCTNQEKLQNNMQECLPAFLAFLKSKGLVNGCELCGEAKSTECCYLTESVKYLCEDCYASVSQRTEELMNGTKKKENIIAGIVGALLGSLLGVVSIILLSQLGYVAAVSGVIMAVCTLSGYEILGGKLTKRGIVISAVIMIVMTYVGDRLDWAIMIARQFDTDIFYSYRLVPVFLAEEAIDITNYIANLVLVYVFLLVGAVPTVRNAMRKEEVAGKVGKLH